MRTSNPAFSSKVAHRVFSAEQSEQMTIRGAINKSIFLVLLVIAAGSISWKMMIAQQPYVMPIVIGAAIVGFILAIITIFSPKYVKTTVPLYAVAEGIFLGGISAMFNTMYNGIVLQAVLLTAMTLFLMLSLYRTGVLKATPAFRKGVIIATGAIAIVYLLNWIISMFGGSGISLIYDNGITGIIFSLVVVGIAAMNLILDFDNIEKGAQMGLSKNYEWYGAFGLLVTLIWLYLEILRLLAKLRR
jgi:uncharacterized YccA/Bax inhibitor family protein